MKLGDLKAVRQRRRMTRNANEVNFAAVSSSILTEILPNNDINHLINDDFEITNEQLKSSSFIPTPVELVKWR